MIRSVFGRIVENGGEEETDGDGPLVETDDCATNPLGGALGLIHRDQSRNQTDAEASKDTTNGEDRDGSGRSLNSDTDGEDKT